MHVKLEQGEEDRRQQRESGEAHESDWPRGGKAAATVITAAVVAPGRMGRRVKGAAEDAGDDPRSALASPIASPRHRDTLKGSGMKEPRYKDIKEQKSAKKHEPKAKGDGKEGAKALASQQATLVPVPLTGAFAWRFPCDRVVQCCSTHCMCPCKHTV